MSGYPQRAYPATAPKIRGAAETGPTQIVAPDLQTLLRHMPHVPIEKALRNLLMAQAAGASEWSEDSQATNRHKWQRAAQELSESFPREQLGIVRDFCFGAIGYGVMAPRKAATLAVIGSSAEAEAQLLAALRMRRFSDVRIYSKQTVAAASLAKRIRKDHDLTVRVAASPEEALHQAQVIVLATGEAKPVVFADWVTDGALVTCVYPQGVVRHEIDPALLNRSKLIASESPTAIGADASHIVKTLPARRRVTHLGAMLGRYDPEKSRGTVIHFLSRSVELNLPVLNAIAAARQT